MFSLFLKDPSFPEGATASMCRVELVKLLPVHQYSVDIFLYSGPTGKLGSDGTQIPLKPVLGGVGIVALSISSHEQT